VNLRSVSDGSMFVLDPRSDRFIRDEAGLYRFEFHAVEGPKARFATYYFVASCCLFTFGAERIFTGLIGARERSGAPMARALVGS